MEYVIESPKKTTVCCEVDICVIGGSCTGVFAAVRAARLGASVALVEKHNCFGGVATAGMVNVWHSLHDVDGKNQVIAGLTQEMLERLAKSGAVSREQNANSAYRLDTEMLKIELDALVSENKITPFLHTMYCAPYMEDDSLKGVFVQNKDGRQVILASFFIDASGDGDLARDIGVENYTYDHIQPPSPCFKIIGDLTSVDIPGILQKHGQEFGLPDDWGWGGPIPGIPNLSFRADTHVFNLNCANANDLTKAEMEGRRQMLAVISALRKYAPNNPDLRIAAICSQIGIRETRHFVSDYKLNSNDLLNGVKFDDAVAFGTYRVDIHHAHNAGITFRELDGREDVFNDRVGPPEHRMWRTGNDYARFYQVPFRALIQRKTANLIAAGRMINADMDAFGAIRVMVNMNQLGEAAGVAAVNSLSTGTPVYELDGIKIRTDLRNGGSAV